MLGKPFAGSRPASSSPTLGVVRLRLLLPALVCIGIPILSAQPADDPSTLGLGSERSERAHGHAVEYAVLAGRCGRALDGLRIATALTIGAVAAPSPQTRPTRRPCRAAIRPCSTGSGM